jgi:hypothetical protein
MPRYSIVIPTVDRPNILRETLAATLAQPRDDIEVLVSDNFSDPRTQAVLDTFDDPRLRKFRTDRRMPMPAHWEWIWPKTTGDYVIYICDDCALTEAALKAADYAIDNHDADIVSWRSAHYYHPDWHVKFRHLPDRGNILAVDMGFSNGLFRVNSEAVVRHFCETLRLSACFPSVVGLVVRREIGNAVAAEIGKFHWAPCPDISAGLMSLVRAREGRFFFWDGLGGIGGRSAESNTASFLSKGKSSPRLREYLDEFPSREERFPDHDIELESITNLLAASVTQARSKYPDRFPDCDLDLKTLVLRSIDDAYRDQTVPWADDETFIAQLDRLIDRLEPKEAEEARTYLAKARDDLRVFQASGDEHFNPTPRANSSSRLSNLIRMVADTRNGRLVDRVRMLASLQNDRTPRLSKKTRRKRNVAYWEYAGTTFIDLDLYGGQTIRDVPRVVPMMLEEFEPDDSGFLPLYRQLGMLGEPLATIKP